ncbi:hypothetical protein DFO70_1439 [Cytobacillus firmus]|uniref:Uncharacterized protein n=2 Tax=Cytobacillus TaxID=2675230 RepID=A0A366JEP4_CYTFI|nr:hypothetical protein COD11_12845 [Bacillus sp. AFS040349]RBP85413.1 hypothetical protein DFO70_1439 [Cytobacillus firmus]TDX35963.1 hypothetical protein DFO72_12321 [Cytobacillus oceanisediminis]
MEYSKKNVRCLTYLTNNKMKQSRISLQLVVWSPGFGRMYSYIIVKKLWNFYYLFIHPGLLYFLYLARRYAKNLQSKKAEEV